MLALTRFILASAYSVHRAVTEMAAGAVQTFGPWAALSRKASAAGSSECDVHPSPRDRLHEKHVQSGVRHRPPFIHHSIHSIIYPSIKPAAAGTTETEIEVSSAKKPIEVRNFLPIVSLVWFVDALPTAGKIAFLYTG